MVTLILLSLVSFAGMPTAAVAEDWPGWLGPRRDNSTTEKIAAWKSPLKTVWTQPVGEGNSSVVIADGRAYLHTKAPGKNEEALHAFDAKTGKPLWSKSYKRMPFRSLFGNGPRATPQVVDGKVYTYGITCILTCFDAATGDIVWQVDALKEFFGANLDDKELAKKNLFFGASCSPLVVGDHVMINVGAKGASIVAFDKNTGKLAWKTLDDRASYASGNVEGKGETQQALFLTGAHVVSLSPRDGSVFWKFPLVDKLAESSTTPIVAGDTIIASSVTYGSVALELDRKTNVPSAKKLWMNPNLNSYFSTPVAVGKQLYIVTATRPPALNISATLRCVDLASGKEYWTREKVGNYHASLLRTGDHKILLLEEKGKLILIDPSHEKCQELASSQICGKTWSHPAVANGRLYVRDQKELVCIQLAP